MITDISGVRMIPLAVHGDSRGRFVKTFTPHMGVAQEYEEMYYTASDTRVLRGLHFQLPPYSGYKYIYCTYGRVLDVIVDMRDDSPTYLKHDKFELAHDTLLCLPPLIAHGFYVIEGPAIVEYRCTMPYSPKYDTGVRWNSAGIDWPDLNPIVSARDSHLPTLEDWK